MKRTYSLYRGKVSKLGKKMAYTGTPAGNTCEKHEVCVGCYATEGNFRFPCVKKGLEKVEFGLRHERDKVFEDFQAQIDQAKIPITLVRIHHSGDFIDFDHLLRWLKMAEMNPQIKFYTYTKKYYLFRRFWKGGQELPENFFLNVSVWNEKGIEEWNEFRSHRNVNCFVVDMDKKAVKLGGSKMVRCPTYDINGKNNGHTCDECGLCFSTRHLEIHCWKH